MNAKQWRKLMTEHLPGYDPYADADTCRFDCKPANKIVSFFENCLTHIEGALAGHPFLLEPWQKAIVGCLFGWKRPDGYRRYRELFLFVPRKNGKTPLVAGIALFVLFCDGEIGAQNICAAGDVEQATLLFRHASGMVQNEPWMANSSQTFAGYGQRSIVNNAERSNLKVISSDASTKHGGNGHLAIVDELHTQRGRELVDVLQTSMASVNRKQPLFVSVTTSDYGRESICNEKYDRACRVRSGEIQDPYFLPVIYGAPEGADWTSPDVWAIANPNLDISVSREYLERECDRAQDTPGYENTFKRLHLNIKTEQANRWLSMERWKDCAIDADGNPIDAITWRADALERLAGQECVGGLDLGSNSDLTALILLFNDGDAVEALPFFWIPREEIYKRERETNQPYRKWVKDGFAFSTDGDVTDYDKVRADINTQAGRFGIRELAVDRAFQGDQLILQLQDDGLPVSKFVNGMLSMTSPSKDFERLVISGEFRHGNNPILSWMAANVAVRHNSYDNLMPTKVHSQGKIDGIVAAIMGLAMLRTKTTSVYEEPGASVWLD